MIEPLKWDSEFFGKRIGALTKTWTRESIEQDLATARQEGYDYLISRPPVDDAAAIRALEGSGFYLTDLGVTWFTDVADYLDRTDRHGGGAVRAATEADIPWLSDAASTMFPLSRFYHDPFYTKADADRLHAAWLANSVRGQAADSVWMAPGSGFVTCKLRDDAGEIILIGVVDGARMKGAGRALMTTALEWFASKGVTTVRVKTQVKNLRAMNFYHRLGFDLHSTDMTMGCILSTEGNK